MNKVLRILAVAYAVIGWLVGATALAMLLVILVS